MVPRRDLPTSGLCDAVSAFHHESCVQGCHEGCTPGSDERQRTQLRFKGQQGLEVVPSSSQVTLVSFSERGARPEEAVGRPSPPLPCRPVVRVVGKQHVLRSGGPPNLIPTSTPRSTRDRARSLVQMGELSAARGALQALPVAPGTMATLAKLTDPERRPPLPREEWCQEVVNSVPERSFKLDPVEFLVCPSGMTADLLSISLDNEADSMLLVAACSLLATGDVPLEIIEGLRVGRLTALQKLDGGVRGIVVGDIVRRLVARTMAKQVAKQAEKATAPFQYALSTNAVCECIAHIVQSLTGVDSNATIVSIDGVGAYDLISKNSMLRRLLRMENGDQILPFVWCFYGRPSTYLWEKRSTSHRGGRGGRRPSHADVVLPRTTSRIGGSSGDDCVTRRNSSHIWTMWFSCAGQIALPKLKLLSEKSYRRHAHVDVHQGKTQVWNRGGIAQMALRSSPGWPSW